MRVQGGQVGRAADADAVAAGALGVEECLVGAGQPEALELLAEHCL